MCYKRRTYVVYSHCTVNPLHHYLGLHKYWLLDFIANFCIWSVSIWIEIYRIFQRTWLPGRSHAWRSCLSHSAHGIGLWPTAIFGHNISAAMSSSRQQPKAGGGSALDHFILSGTIFDKWVSNVSVLHEVDNLLDVKVIAIAPLVSWVKASENDFNNYRSVLSQNLKSI